MTPTLQQFTRALLAPDLSLRTLTAARTVTGRDGLPRLVRTTLFAEAQIDWQGSRWLLSMPLTPSALTRLERTASALRRINTEALVPYRILPGELCWDAAGERHTCDLVLQLLPEGRPFEEALLTEPKERLLAALDALEAQLRELCFTHGNLKEENLRWCGSRLVPIRYHDAHLGEPAGGDAAAFEALRRKISDSAGPQQALGDAVLSYDPVRRLTGHRWASHVFEGLVCVEDAEGFGFVDTDNNPVIPAQYLWAGDFHEGRAEVQTAQGMGLIDRRGRYVIPPEYEIVEYDPAKSIVEVRQNGRWALFDYLGRRLTEFGTNRESAE